MGCRYGQPFHIHGLLEDHPVKRYALCATFCALVLGACSSDGTGPQQQVPVPAKLSFTAGPTGAVADSALSSSITVAVLDSSGDIVDDATPMVTLALQTNTSGVTMSGGTPVAAVNGVATFSNVVFSNTGSGLTLEASATGLEGDTSVAFAVTLSLADTDLDGVSPDAGDCNDGDPAIHPAATDHPDDLYLDTNCDGLDGEAANAIFVATAGSDAGACDTMTAPCLTIAGAIAKAAGAGKRDVYVSQGVYTAAAFAIGDGVNVYGGYDASANWGRDAAHTVTVNGSHNVNVGATEPQTVVVYASSLTLPTIVSDLTFANLSATDTTATGQGKSAYTILLRDIPAGILTLRNSTIIAGDGADGADGSNGADASLVFSSGPMTGTNGGGGGVGVGCGNERGASGPGGFNAGAGGAASGGAGGGGGLTDNDCSFPPDLDAGNGLIGISAATFAAGSFGYRGLGGLGANCSAGFTGNDGRVINGAGGDGAASNGQLIADLWTGFDGEAGDLGEHGTGGGGGGGGGGCDLGADTYGAGGGGGGAGGMRALGGGGGGRAGGGAFGVYLINASPTLSGLSIVMGHGGDGGSGGQGGRGQSGGEGGAGGVAHTGLVNHGGPGGDGGHGGHGGGGGGGAGGISAGIFTTSAASVPVLTGLSFVTGASGMGGLGGPSAPAAPPSEQDGNDGQNGAPGPVAQSTTCASPAGC